MTAKPGRKSDGYDPSRKQGLIPVGAQALPPDSRNLSGDTGAMYIVGTQVVRPSKGGGEEYVSENIGRERQEKSKRRRERDEEEDRLNQLLTRDGGLSSGAKALAQVRATTGSAKQLGLRTNEKSTRAAFSAEALKRIGFDPTSSKQIASDVDVKRKVRVVILYTPLCSLFTARSAGELAKAIQENTAREATVRRRLRLIKGSTLRRQGHAGAWCGII
jgi:hypothetical protein